MPLWNGLAEDVERAVMAVRYWRIMRERPFVRGIRRIVAIGAAAWALQVAVASGQTRVRPQLVVENALADMEAETVQIDGRNLLWPRDDQIVVTLGGAPLQVLSATENQVLAQLPPSVVSGTYLLSVSRGPS